MMDYGPGNLTDYDVHPPGMLNNMIAHLVNPILAHVPLPKLKELPLLGERPELSELCNFFQILIEALPKGEILFCIIDGILYYEDRARRGEFIEILSMLTNLANTSREPSGECVTKLLKTAPLKSQVVPELFTGPEILDMNEYIPPSGGFSALHWDGGIGRATGS